MVRRHEKQKAKKTKTKKYTKNKEDKTEERVEQSNNGIAEWKASELTHPRYKNITQLDILRGKDDRTDKETNRQNKDL